MWFGVADLFGNSTHREINAAGSNCAVGILTMQTSYQDDLRVDGRGCEDYRHMEIETDVVSNTDGSAKVTLVSQIVMTGVINIARLPP